MSSYDNEVVTRAAPRWAWDIIDETLAMDAQSGAFDKDLRDQISRANNAMIASSEEDETHRFSREADETPEVFVWPTVGPDFNQWHTDLETFIDLLHDAKSEPFWCTNFRVKYLTIRIDTRDNAWLLFADGRRDGDEKVRIDPQEVIDSIDKWNKNYGGRKE